MKKLSFGMGIGLVALALALIAVLYERNVRLHSESELLRQQADEWSRLTLENEALSNQLLQIHSPLAGEKLSELLRLRREVSALQQQINEMQRQRENLVARQRSVAKTVTSPSHDYVSRESLAFAGYGTPEAGLETAWWAASQSDVRSFLASLGPEMLKHIEEVNLSAEQFQAALKEETDKIKGYHILNAAGFAQDQVILDVSFDGEVRQVRLERVGDEWKLAALITRGTNALPNQPEALN